MLKFSEVQNIIMLELVAPEDPDSRLISEEESRELYKRFVEQQPAPNWDYVFGAIKDESFKNKMIELYIKNDTEG